jgi:restriction system protein
VLHEALGPALEKPLNQTADTNLWGIHAGKTGDADSLFLKKNCVAVGWTEMGDLSALKPDRDAFKARVAEVYPARPGRCPTTLGSCSALSTR